MNLRGITIGGKILSFTFADCPVVVTDSQVALFGRVWSPILDLKTITRGTAGIYEGDIIVDKSTGEELGYVIFSEGFCLYTSEGNLKKIPPRNHISVKTGNKKTMQFVTALHCRTILCFTYKHLVLTIDSFVTKVGSSLAIKEISELIAPWKVRFSTGLIDERKHKLISLGQNFYGGIIILQDMDIYVQYPDNSMELLKNVVKRV